MTMNPQAAGLRLALAALLIGAGCAMTAAQTTVPQGAEHPGAACPPGTMQNAPTVGRPADGKPLSDQLAELISHRYGISWGRINVVPLSVDLQRFSPDAVSDERVDTMRRSFGVDSDTKLILVTGRLLRRKGHHLVVQAVHRLKDMDLLIIAGETIAPHLDESNRSVLVSLDRHPSVRHFEPAARNHNRLGRGTACSFVDPNLRPERLDG